jgi:hypothetical protein
METARFTEWLTGLEQLAAVQPDRVLRELMSAKANDPAHGANCPREASVAVSAADGAPSTPAVNSVDAAPYDSPPSSTGRGRIAGLLCPHCGEDDVGRWGEANGKPRYRCANCGRTFYPPNGTQLAGLHYRERRRDQLRALINGESLARAAELCNVGIAAAA